MIDSPVVGSVTYSRWVPAQTLTFPCQKSGNFPFEVPHSWQYQKLGDPHNS